MTLHNILIVDDEESNLYALERVFRGDYNVFSATNGEDALAIMERNDIALILADPYRLKTQDTTPSSFILHPSSFHFMTGIELLKKVLRKYPDTVRIILTAYTNEKLLLDAINIVRVHRYLIKPWKPEEIKSIVKEEIQAREITQDMRHETRITGRDACATRVSCLKSQVSSLTLGMALIERGVISRSQLNMAMKLQEPGLKSGETLLHLGAISPEELEIALELQLAEILIGLGYADERDIFGPSRISVVPGD